MGNYVAKCKNVPVDLGFFENIQVVVFISLIKKILY